MSDRLAEAAFLEVEHITVEFPGVRALDDVQFGVRAGEVHALVGENGAGKSTLLKVLGGVYVPTAGRIRLEGVEFRPAHPSDAITAGIAVIYQEFTLFPDLTVAENVYVGREPYSRNTRGIRFGEMRAECRRIFELLGVDIDPDARVADIGVAEQQLVEIARALSTDGRVIVMDEPTAALNRSEVASLLGVVRRLRDEGRAIIYVSHHLEEVFEVADRVTVLRDGKNVATTDVTETDETELVRHMVGRDVELVTHRDRRREGRSRLAGQRPLRGFPAAGHRPRGPRRRDPRDRRGRGRGPVGSDPGDLRRHAHQQGRHGVGGRALRPTDTARRDAGWESASCTKTANVPGCCRTYPSSRT